MFMCITNLARSHAGSYLLCGTHNNAKMPRHHTHRHLKFFFLRIPDVPRKFFRDCPTGRMYSNRTSTYVVYRAVRAGSHTFDYFMLIVVRTYDFGQR